MMIWGVPDVSNRYGKIIVKIPKVGFNDGVRVELINGTRTVYGDYSQNLSVKADDIRVVNQRVPQTKVRPQNRKNSGGGKGYNKPSLQK